MISQILYFVLPNLILLIVFIDHFIHDCLVNALHNEQELLDRLASGDPDAFSIIFNHYWFDEFFKGTNVKDAYDGTLAVTEAFAEYQDCLFIVSTHIIEVGEVLKGAKNIQFAFMLTIMEGARPGYTYQLDERITEDRQGMMIIRNEGIWN